MAMTFRQIEAFRAIMATGTVTQAAEMLHVSQPVVSRMLSDLESEIGFMLFDRTGRQLVPTDEARALLHEVHRAFVGLRDVSEAAKAIHEFRAGHLRLITLPSIASSIMPALLLRFTAAYPDVAVSLEVQSSQRVFEWLVSLQCDLGIASLPVESAHIETTPLLRADSVCLLPIGHRLAANACIAPRDLAGEDFISFKSDSTYRFRVDQIFDAALIRRKLKIDARTAETIFSLVGAGLGVSIVPPFFSKAMADGVMVRRFEPALPEEVGILRPTHKPLSRIAQQFIALTAEFMPSYQRAGNS
ncbi:LysR substrate-binding domain-containing protein [Caballeronia sp. dw_19]|uniref:LysR substrate-binding domain-containing protein n=1 Tax=Caballeronia sp. dw_19 TaxID=2719791 RepID=UPI001BD6D038|nr:LysR substrate-binding domain-containing protein [Caballeronia sp. dw_19]